MKGCSYELGLAGVLPGHHYPRGRSKLLRQERRYHLPGLDAVGLGLDHFRVAAVAGDRSGRRIADRHAAHFGRSEEHTSELQSPDHLVCRLLLEKKKNMNIRSHSHIFVANTSITQDDTTTYHKYH